MTGGRRSRSCSPGRPATAPTSFMRRPNIDCRPTSRSATRSMSWRPGPILRPMPPSASTGSSRCGLIASDLARDRVALGRAPGFCRGGSGSDFLLQHIDQPLNIAAVLRDDRCELVALGNRHAETLGRHVDDLVCRALESHPPVDVDRRAATRANDLRGDHRSSAVAGFAAHHLELFALIVAEALRIDRDDILPEHAKIFLLLFRRGFAPIMAENETADRRNVEILREQLGEGGFALRLRLGTANDPDRLIAQ